MTQKTKTNEEKEADRMAMQRLEEEANVDIVNEATASDLAAALDNQYQNIFKRTPKALREKKTELEEVESKLLKLKADLETLGLAINNRLESEKNRITGVNSDGKNLEGFSPTGSLSNAPKATAQPMFY